jgi:hypothetical protein
MSQKDLATSISVWADAAWLPGNLKDELISMLDGSAERDNMSDGNTMGHSLYQESPRQIF